MKYILVLGRDQELSLYEIEQTLNLKPLKVKHNLALYETETKPNIEVLGGTTRIAEVIKMEDIENIDFQQKLKYHITGDNEDLTAFLKSFFKKNRIKAQYKKDEPTPTQLLQKDRIEFIALNNLIAITSQVYNPKQVKFRDINRPEVDFVKATSIRMAKILVNLSKAKPNQILLDPFCGSGTILQEAMLKNINVIGTDIEKKSIEQSQKNLEWLKKNYPINAEYSLIQTNIKTLTKHIKKADAVVTEPYMGEFLKRKPDQTTALNQLAKLNPLYEDLFIKLSKILRPSSRVVIMLPVFKTKNSVYEAKPSGKFKILKKMPYNYAHNILQRNIYVLEYTSKS